MTSTRCPNGHLSSESDYCDVCGARLGAPAELGGTQPPAGSAPVGAEEPTQTPDGLPCPRCGTINAASDKFCEGCGLNFADPGAPSAEPPSSEAAATPTAVTSEAASTPTVAATGWVAIVTADRDYFERTDAGDIEFPADCPERRVPLMAEQVTIGRRSRSRSITPDIDLGEPPEDIGVSHEHAILTRNADGAWLLADRGSTNGTFHNDGETPITQGEPVSMSDGDRIHLGAWTTITLSRNAPVGS
ncbi:MAG: FHA domain-containing protein [Solirubrobacteraceae bacterium]